MISDVERAQIRAGRARNRKRVTKWGATVETYDATSGKTFARFDGSSDARQVQPLGQGPYGPGERILVDLAGGFVATSVAQADQSFAIGAGPVVVDTVTGDLYRVKVTSGTLGIVAL